MVQRRRGWTLLEVLVVLAIIAVLAVIIYALATYALEMSRQGNCISNLRQIGVALKLYMEDYKQADWDTEIDSYMGIADRQERKLLVARWGFPQPNGLLALYQGGYIKTKEVFKCRSIRSEFVELFEVHYGYDDPSFFLHIPGIISGQLNTFDDNLWRLKQEKHNYEIVVDTNHDQIRICLHLDGRIDRRPPRYINRSGYTITY